MDWKDQPAANDIEQFLRDVREHFKASLETSEYENTSNMFHATEAESTLNLLLRCELLLANCSQKNGDQPTPNNNKHCIVNGQVKSNEVKEGINGGVNGVNGQTMQTNIINAADSQCNNNILIKNATATKQTQQQQQEKQQQQQQHQQKQPPTQQQQAQQHEDDASYLDMSGGGRVRSKKSSSWYDNWNNETKSDKTFRCSAHFIGGNSKTHSQAYSDDDFDDDDDDDDGDNVDDENESETNNDEDNGSQNYDICHVSSHHDHDEMQKAITPELEPMQNIDCPYMDLPAGHLSIENATKYGQLQRIEKRFIFDQCKKYYCGVLNDWLLCYADGPTSAHPTITLYLKHNGIEIEHYGEGKRREVCFQITTADPNKKFLFQANSEVDAKEWIIAVEAAIRGDTSSPSTTTFSATPANNVKLGRKLPTPPILKKITFVGHPMNRALPPAAHDCIYEEPSPLFQTEKSAANNKPPTVPQKKEALPALDMDNCFEYDVPKGQPQPIKSADSSHTESETAELLNLSDNSVLSREKIEFKSIVKDVHSKLSSQLSAAGPTPERLKRTVKKTYSNSSSGSTGDTEALTLTPATSPTVKEQKKQRKSLSTPTSSPQKCSNSNSMGINSPNSNHTNSSNSNSGNERTAVKSWFFNRLNKTTSSGRSTSSSNSTASTSPAKCKQSEKENLLQSLELHDSVDGGSPGGTDCLHNNSSNPASPILKTSASCGSAGTGVDSSMKSKVDLIIKEFETSAHMGILTMETLAGSAVASLSSFCDNDCNNYEPIMTVTTPPSSFLKKI